jgi:nucleosome binding factor SPN SPT16 subunit
VRELETEERRTRGEVATSLRSFADQLETESNTVAVDRWAGRPREPER